MIKKGQGIRKALDDTIDENKEDKGFVQTNLTSTFPVLTYPAAKQIHSQGQTALDMILPTQSTFNRSTAGKALNLGTLQSPSVSAWEKTIGSSAGLQLLMERLSLQLGFSRNRELLWHSGASIPASTKAKRQIGFECSTTIRKRSLRTEILAR